MWTPMLADCGLSDEKLIESAERMDCELADKFGISHDKIFRDTDSEEDLKNKSFVGTD